MLNVIRIAIKELKVFRDVKMLLFMLATPVMIMLILGTALSNDFNGTVSIGELRVLYQNESTDRIMALKWESFVQDASQSGIIFEEADMNRDEVLHEVQKGQYTGYAVITDSEVDYVGNSGNPIENSIVHGMLTAFSDAYKLAVIMKEQNDVQTAGSFIARSDESYVNETWITAARQPGALDYFAVAMTTMIILYSAMTAGLLMENERKRNTSIRLLVSPITKMELFTGKIVGTFVLNALFIVIVVLFSKYVFGVYWGDQLPLVLLVLFSQIIFALGLGLGISYMIKGSASGAVLMIFIQLEAFFGGAYFPVDDISGFIGVLSQFSPLRLTNHAVFQIIYAENMAAVLPVMLFNTGCAALLLTLAAILMRRREGL